MSTHKDYNGYRILLMKAIHYGFSLFTFYVFFLLFRYGKLTDLDSYGFRYNYYATMGYGVLLYFFNRTYNSYLLGFSRIRALVLGQISSQVFSLILIYLVLSLAWNRFFNPEVFFGLLLVQFAYNWIWSYFGNWMYYRLHGRLKTLFVYRNAIDKRRFGSMYGKPIERMYEVIDEMQFDGSFTELIDKIGAYDAIFVSGVNSSCRNGILKYCEEKGIPGYFLPHVGDTIMQAAKHVQAFDSPVLYLNRKQLMPEYAIVKRLFDIVASGLALVALSPLIIITAIAIKAFDGGPIFYKQTRLTKDNKEFKILKFRSMRVDAEQDGIARLSTGNNDDRVTSIGKVIRRFRLDELPQLWNIFCGDMAVVGPRPERPEIAEQYYKSMPDFKLRLQVKAGLTGYAQIYGKYNTAPYEKLEFDLLYINNMNFLMDLQLCFATLMTLFKRESTEGVNGITAEDEKSED